MLNCNQKPLEPFLSKGINVPKLNWWSMELADCKIMFVHIKGKSNVNCGIFLILFVLSIKRTKVPMVLYNRKYLLR